MVQHDCSGSVTGGPDRRRFLKQGASAVTLAALATQRGWAADSAPKKVRVGVVGGGFGTQFHFHQHPDCVVEAVSDLRPERRKGLMDVYKCGKSYDSLEELVLDKNIDAVAIFTDGPLHVDHVTKVMKHGKHALSAVPAAWGSVDEAEQLLDIVKTTGLKYMLAETSYYYQTTMSARKFYQEGKFGEIFYSRAAYEHDGLEAIFFENGKRTWRHGMAPMHYPTHTTAFLIGVTGERLTEVVCHGWGDDHPILKDNAYDNPFWNESALFKTDRGHAFEGRVWWKGAGRGGETAEWVGTQMSYYSPTPNGQEPVQWWDTDLLPEPLRQSGSGHYGSHPFLTHEFIDAVAHDRNPAIDVYEALAYTVPGIVAHQSALRGGELMKIPQYDPPNRGAKKA